jgi:hypothetical protein
MKKRFIRLCKLAPLSGKANFFQQKYAIGVTELCKSFRS